ncbi:MAG: hypothetical protein Q9161_008477 [Pseudevernia consocians]
MADAFLYELLQMHNSVHNPEERCTICLEEYGTLSRDTGNLEVAIRLPCNHTVGSACIATWLRSNNTCPVCRHAFFPAQPRPYLEHGIMDDDDDDDGHADEHALQTIRSLNEDYCDQLGLDVENTLFSALIVQRLWDSPHWNEGHTDDCLVAVAIYMASHLTRDPRSPREIAAVTGVDAAHIRSAYDLIYPQREQLLAETRLRHVLADAFDATGPWHWPAPGDRFSDEQIEHDHVSRMLEEACAEGCEELGLGARVAALSIGVAEVLRARESMARFSPRSVMAVGILMASCLVGCPVAVGRVSAAVGVDEVVVRSVYALAYGGRYEGLEEVLLEDVGRGSVESVLECLPSPSALT